MIANEADMAAKRRVRVVLEYLDIGPEDRVLDCGCGLGWFLKVIGELTSCRLTGSDYDLPRLAVGLREVAGRASVALSDILRLPYADATFDKVVLSEVLEHLPDDAGGLAEVRRVLRPGGLAWIEMPNAHGALNTARRLHRPAPSGADVRYWTPAQLRRVFSAIGPVELIADGFLTINPQPADLDLLRPSYRVVVRVSERLRWASTHVPALVGVADSLIVKAVRP